MFRADLPRKILRHAALLHRGEFSRTIVIGGASPADGVVEGKALGTGFVFKDATASALYDTIGWACSTYYDRPAEFAAMQQRGMAKNFAWKVSAEHYVNVYRWAVSARARVEI